VLLIFIIRQDAKKRWERQSRAFYNLFRQPDRVEKLAQIIERLVSTAFLTLLRGVFVLFAHGLSRKECVIELNGLLFYRSKVISSFVSEHWNQKEHFKELPQFRRLLDM
jgi:hypothetical protein